jgi:phosphoribosylformylglycinamidine synthase PurS subunit
LRALIYITPKEGILDPQGLTVGKALQNLGLKAITGVRFGKYIELDLPGTSKKDAERLTREACDRLLANPHIESYRFELTEDA